MELVGHPGLEPAFLAWKRCPYALDQRPRARSSAVEHSTFNRVVDGSNPSGLTNPTFDGFRAGHALPGVPRAGFVSLSAGDPRDEKRCESTAPGIRAAKILRGRINADKRCRNFYLNSSVWYSKGLNVQFREGNQLFLRRLLGLNGPAQLKRYTTRLQEQ